MGKCQHKHAVQVPNAELIKDLKWINPQGEEVSQDSRYQIFILLHTGCPVN